MKRRVELIEFLTTETTGIYTIKFQDKAISEFDEFMYKFKDTDDDLIKDDFNRIIMAIKKISESGALERYFRIEGNTKIMLLQFLYILRKEKITRH